MQMNLKHNEGTPGALCCPHNDPLPSSTQVTYPTGWAGRISIGPVGDENVITRGSTIEASFIDGKVWIAVSYVQGYTYPMYLPIIHPYPLLFTNYVQHLLVSRCGRDRLQLSTSGE